MTRFSLPSSAATLFQATPTQIKIPFDEVLRYMGFQRGYRLSPSEQELVAAALRDFEAVVSYRACACRMPLLAEDGLVDFGAFRLDSANLAANLRGCREGIVFAATVGIEADRQRMRASLSSVTKALVLEAAGTAAVEALCNALCADWAEALSARGLFLRPRFSPGYGDLPLTAQIPLLQTLNSFRTVGISVTPELLMIPKKSVSAIVGIGEDGCRQNVQACELCPNTACLFRR